jgi:hypothetical protein
LYAAYQQNCINSRDYTILEEFVCDFIEDENGLMFFLKVHSVKIVEPRIKMVEWKTSSTLNPPKIKV